jgi:hypothetical protein
LVISIGVSFNNQFRGLKYKLKGFESLAPAHYGLAPGAHGGSKIAQRSALGIRVGNLVREIMNGLEA